MHILVGTDEGKNLLGRPSSEGKGISKLVLRRQGVWAWVWIRLVQDKDQCCQHSNAASDL
jgi:hypothetical protein